MKHTGNSKYTWDLEAILNGSSFDQLYQQWLNKQNEILKIYPHFLKSLSNFKKWLLLDDEYEILSNRVGNYVSNNYNEDLTNQKWIAWSQKMSNDSNKFHVQLSNLTNEIVKNESLIRKYLKDPKIKHYDRDFELTFRTKPHILSDEEQKVLSTMGIVNGGFSQIFSTLNDSEVKFKNAIDNKGKQIPLKTIADVMINIKHKDRDIRKSTWINFNEAYHNYENTFTQTLYYNYLMLNTSSKIHKFKDYVGATAFSDEIDEKLITKLYKNTEQYKTSFIKYRNTVNKLLKKQLKISQLEPWDKTVDLNKKEIKFTIEETKGIILNAFKPLGVEYVKNIQTAFNERWISWMPKPGKQQGAYSIDGTKGLSKYYISMNFDNSIRSVSTIAHELGHSMNSLYINKKQDIYTDVSIFYAEIASITNEMLLSYYLLDKYRNDFEMSKMILDEMINNFFATVSRQIIFSNTEYLLNEYVNESKPFTKEAVKQIYLTMIDKYQGIAQDMKNKIHQEPYSFSQSTILRIPHFYAGNFYVYKYAIGQIVAINVAYKIHKGDKNTISKYFDFLSSGSSLSPLDTIKLLGVDLNDNQVYSETKKIIDQWIQRLNKIA